MNKLIIVIMLFLFLGCNSETEIKVVITHIEKESTKWGCMGVDTRTWIKVLDTEYKGRRRYLCGTVGEPGDTLRMFWINSFFNQDVLKL